MFVIVHENFVVWGPKTWNKLGFEDVLRTDCEVEYTLPQRNDEQAPFIINENTKILKVVDLPNPESNPKTQRLNGPYWNFYADYAESYYLAENLPVYFVKDTLKGIIANNRYAKEVGGIKLTIQGTEVSIDTTRDGRQIYLDSYLAIGESETINWKFLESWIALTKSDLQQIVSAGKTHIQACFDWERTKGQEIDAANTLQELDAIPLSYGE